SSTTSGGALMGTFLSGSVWSNQSQLTHMEYRFNRAEHRPVKAEAAGSSPVSPDARFKKCVTPDCESHRHTRAWNYTLEEVSQSLPFALAFLHLMHLGKEAKLFKSE
ncbi:hypothetical protein Tco_0577002, partial [Tanacetum coccineum]